MPQISPATDINHHYRYEGIPIMAAPRLDPLQDEEVTTRVVRYLRSIGGSVTPHPLLVANEENEEEA